MKLECDIACPSCDQNFRQRVAEIRPRHSRTCPHCGTTIQWSGDDGATAQRALDKLEREMKKLPKTIELRF